MFCEHRGSSKRVLRWSQWVKCVLRAWGQLKSGLEVVALGQMFIEGMGVVEKGVQKLIGGCIYWTK